MEAEGEGKFTRRQIYTSTSKMENTRSAGEMRQTRSSPSFQGAGDPSLLRGWHVFFMSMLGCHRN